MTKGTLYEVKVQGATRSLKESSKLYRGDFSESRKVILQSKCISKFYLFPSLLNLTNHAYTICLSISIMNLSFSVTHTHTQYKTKLYSNNVYRALGISLWAFAYDKLPK